MGFFLVQQNHGKFSHGKNILYQKDGETEGYP